MLVLTRKKDQRIVCVDGEKEVVITIVAIEGGRVRVGIEAGENVQILRGELKRKIDLEGKE